MKRVFIIIPLLGALFFSSSKSQTIDMYRVEPFPKSMDFLQGESTLIFGGETNWEISSSIDLPFDFNYLGQNYDKISVFQRLYYF